MPKYITTDLPIHPLAEYWAAQQNELCRKKFKIMEALKWSERTFNEKILQGVKNNLELTQTEAQTIANITGLEFDLLFNN